MPGMRLTFAASIAALALLVAGASRSSVPVPATGGAPASSPAPGLSTPRPATTPGATALPRALATESAAASATQAGGIPSVPEPSAAENPDQFQNEREARWQALVEEHLGGLPGDFGVVVKDMENGDTFALNGDKPYATASLYKLWLATVVLRRGEVGTLDLEEVATIEPRHMAQSEFDEQLTAGMEVSLERSLWFLITLSSNSAALLLNDYVEWSELNALLSELGFAGSRMAPDRSLPALGDWRDDSASSTPNEVQRFFELAYSGKLVSEAVSGEMMYLLRNQQIDDRLSRRLPQGVAMAHKTGNLPGVIADAGIIFGPDTDLYVGVMSAGADYELTTKALQDLGRALYDLEN